MLVFGYWRSPGWGAGHRPQGFESFPLRSSIHGQTATKDTNTNEGRSPEGPRPSLAIVFFGYFLVFLALSCAAPWEKANMEFMKSM